MSGASQLPGDVLVDVLGSARESVVVVAPFIKGGALSRVLRQVRVRSLNCVTRWLPGELAAGVGDLEAYEVVKARGGRMLLRQDLHAKYYRGDGRVLVGSANVTHSALGWSAQPNLELLTELEAESHEFPAFERSLLATSVVVSAELYAAVSEAVDGIGPVPAAGSFADFTLKKSPVDVVTWVPQLRQPSELFCTYLNPRDDSISEVARSAALADLSVLRPPPGLGVEAFDRTIASTLLTLPVVQAVDQYVGKPRPFGAVRALLENRLVCERDAAEASLQTIIRWLLHFHSERYRYERPGHSEIFSRR